MFSSVDLGNSSAAFDAFSQAPDPDVITNGGRAAAGLQAALGNKIDLQTAMGASTIRRASALRRARSYAAEVDRMRRSQGPSGLGGILSGALGVGSAITAFNPALKPLSIGLGYASQAAGSYL